MKLMPHQNATRSLSELYIWRPENIPRGCKANYISGLTDESNTLYEAYQEQYQCNPLGDWTIDAENKLTEMMAERKKKRWGPKEGACSIAVPVMSNRPRTSAIRMPTTHPAIRNANHR